ncbi:MAG: nuclear transport factor 2 family protein [Sphingomonadaceae bacterium]
MIPDSPEALADKQAIRDLIYTYCRAVDRIDVPLGHSIWHEDGEADYGASFYQGPGRGVIDLICKSHEGLLSHSHQVTNILIELDGNRAGSEAYVSGTMRLEREGCRCRWASGRAISIAGKSASARGGSPNAWSSTITRKSGPSRRWVRKSVLPATAATRPTQS